jgi:hypothetical protein
MIDLNQAGQQRSADDLIPDGTIVPVVAVLRPGGAGDGNWMKRSKVGDSLALDFEFTVLEGPFAKRKFWSLFTIEGETDGQKKAGEISVARLRAMLESARGIDPAAEDEKSVNARRLTSWADLDGLRFWAKVAVEKGKDGYKDKNQLKAVVTPDHKEWSKLEQVAPTRAANTTTASKPAATGSRPSWAA